MAQNTAQQYDIALLSSVYSVYMNADELDMFEYIVNSYSSYRLDIEHHVVKSVADDLDVVKSYVGFIQMPPWVAEEDDFIIWSKYLNSKGVERSTLRKYHGAVRRFYEYFSENTKIRRELKKRLNVNPTVICDKHVCITHVSQNESSEKTNTLPLSYDDIDRLFAHLDECIEEAETYGGCKDLNPMRRDRVLIYLTYVMGLRADEALRLTLDSFLENPKRPEFGRYGRIRIEGKGHNGSDKKKRTLPIVSIKLPPLLYDYIHNVRPEFMDRMDPNDNTLFLSQKSKRLSYQSYYARFKKYLNEIGLGGKGYALHTLRRTGLTHCAELMSLQTVQLLAGHAHISTTGGYINRQPNIVVREVENVIDYQIDAALNEGL